MFAALPSVSSEGTLTYTLAANANGVSTFDVQVNDGQDTSPAQTFTINVNTVNDAPVLAPIVPQIVHEGKQLNFTVTATDPNDNPSNNLIITAGNLPSGATFVDGEFSWTPAEGQQGVYVLIFTVTDDGSPALSDWKTVTITVTNVSTWTGEGDGVSWNDEDNWSEHSVPGPYDHAIIDDPNTSTVIIGAEDEVTIKSIQCAANLEVHGSLRLTAGESLVTGKFDVTGTLQVDSGNLSLNGGGLFDCNLYVSDQASVVLQDGNFVAQNINAPAPPALYYRSLVVGNDGNGAGLTVGHATTIEIERLTLRDGGTIDGPGEFRITQRLDWNGGKMAGTGITRNIGSMTVSTPGFNGIIQDARMLYNSGEIRWLGGSGQWRMANEAQILNDNQFIIDVTPGRRADIAPAGVASLPGGGLFSNWGTITQVAEGLGSQFNQIAFMNQATGQVIVQSGTLRFFGVEGASNGTFQAAAGTRVLFDLGTELTFSPFQEEPAWTEMMAGDGLYLCQRARIVIPEAAMVIASHFTLKSGTLEVSGQFRAPDLVWQNGTIETPMEANAEGSIVVGAGDSFLIQSLAPAGAGVVATNLVKAQIKVLTNGQLTWNRDAQTDIETRQGASIIVDGGIFTAGAFHAVRRADDAAATLTVQNGGALIVNSAWPYEGFTTTITLPIVNNNSTVELVTSASLESYTQQGDQSALIMQDEQYDFSGFQIVGGQALLNGGQMGAGGQNSHVFGTQSQFKGFGTITGDFTNMGEMELTGDSAFTGLNFWNQGFLFLAGSTLTVGSVGEGELVSSVRNTGAIYLDGGALTAIAPGTIYNGDNQVAGVISGSGTINAPVSNRYGSQLIVGGVDAPGRITINGAFGQDAASSTEIEVGGRLPILQSDLLVINGTANLSGLLSATLIDGYVPDPNDPLDVFDVITFASHNGTFTNNAWPAGTGLFFAVDVQNTKVTLIPIPG